MTYILNTLGVMKGITVKELKLFEKQKVCKPSKIITKKLKTIENSINRNIN